MNNTLKSYYRNFRKQKLIYGITIGGFAMSLAVLILIVSYIIEEKSVDRHFPDIQNMYRIKQADGNAQIPQRIYKIVLDRAPEIEKMCLINKNQVLYEYNGEKKRAQAVCTNKEFFEVFSINVILGKTENLLESKTDVVITESFARLVFGNRNPIGELLNFEDREQKEVVAVIADPLKTSSLKYDILFNPEQQLFHSKRGYNDESYIMFDAIFVLNSTIYPLETQAKITDILKPFEGYEETLLQIQPFKEVYFELKTGHDVFSHANLNMIKLLALIALIILVLAIFNYINLTTALNSERYKEICIRKTTGARRKTIFFQFLTESYLSCFVALLIGIVLATFISPLFKDLLDREINVSEALQNPQIVLAISLIFVFVGGITGIIPALAASKYNAIDLLQRKVLLKNPHVRGVFNTLQLTVTLALIISLITITKQINYVKTKDIGFDKEYLLEVGLEGKAHGKAAVIKENLLQHTDIVDVSATHGRPFGIYSSGSGPWKNDSVEYTINNLAQLNTDTSFLSTFGVKLKAGRNFRLTDNNVCIINNKTAKYLQINELDGKTIWGSEVVGVVEDFHFDNMYNELGFVQLKYNPEEVSHLNIRISGNDIPATLKVIKETLKEIEPALNVKPRFYDDWINTMYHKEERQAKAIVIYAFIALLLSCLGLLGLARFSAIRRTKEIGIRKVNGAKVREILAMLNSGFIKWVLIAFVISCPVSYYAMHKWLESFAYKTNINAWIFISAGILVMGVALLVVSWQSWRAATRNPVEALRYE